MEANKRFEMVPDPEMHAKPSRRRFGRDDILRILGEADKVEGTGRVVEVLRREGIYRSQLSDWQKKRASGAYGMDKIPAGFQGKKAERSKQVQKLQRENASLKKKLHHAQIIIGIQKKVASLMGSPLETDLESEID
ncbi:MAG: transposase [Gemmataceae bacterium]